MTSAGAARQLSAGIILGLSAVIYAISYGALLFSGPLAGYVGFAITSAMITAAIGALFGTVSEEKAFIGGPDSNTISVMIGMFAAIGSLRLPQEQTLELALASMLMTSVVCALSFWLVARLNLAEFVRYIPFSVMAGFLASTGWLMSSGALNIISGTPLTLAGISALWANPYRPELLLGVAVAAALQMLSPRISGGILIPLVMVIASVIANAILASGVCAPSLCSREAWMFNGAQQTLWLPPWDLRLDTAGLAAVMRDLPSMLVVSFVGVLTILLSVASLELSLRKEFQLGRVLRAHAGSTLVSTALGGFVGILSIGRTTLNQRMGGATLSGWVAGLMCVGMLFGAGSLLAYVPKAALGGLVLYLGVGMLKQWLWDQRKTSSGMELAQIGLILALVAHFGYLMGFSSGLAIACAIFVITYSRLPLASLSTNLSQISSSVVRPTVEREILARHGARTHLYRLTGYMFFGSASKIDAMFQQMDIKNLECVIMDFTNVSGIDKSAIGVFQRILRRYHAEPIRFDLVHSEANRAALASISHDAMASAHVSYFGALDYALEAAEERALLAHVREPADCRSFGFLEDEDERSTFLGYCELAHIDGGQLLCREGDYSNAVYSIEAGGLDVIRGFDSRAPMRLAKLGKGEVVGEMAFYTGGARTASIVATVDSLVFVLHKEALVRMRSTHPGLASRFDHMVIGKIAAALARTNRLMGALS